MTKRDAHFIALATSFTLITLVLFAAGTPQRLFARNGVPGPTEPTATTPRAFLPIAIGGQPSQTSRRVNTPYFGSSAIRYSEMAIFWFGQVNLNSNYTDVRVGYNDSELYVEALIFDRRLWYDPNPSPGTLTAWDATSLYLRLLGNDGTAPDTSAFRFDAQLSDQFESRTDRQSAYRGNGSGWATFNSSFTTESTYEWESESQGGANNNQNNRGWVVRFHIPFSSLGLSTRPAQGTLWGLGLRIYDRDDQAGSIVTTSWPEDLSPNQPVTWGQMHFGLPAYTAPSVSARQSVTIRHQLNGAIVPDAGVGGNIDLQGTGSYLCPSNPTFIWNQWGSTTFAGAPFANIQNQAAIADWPCFAKYYITFPLNAIPSGKAIVSATLTLHLQGGSDPTQAEPSLIQILAIADDWSEATLTWNNAPIPFENVSRAWVDVDTGCGSPSVPWPCVPYTWDLSRAVSQAYNAGQPLRLALYSADAAYHSGKYFTTSDAEDWDAAGRPTLRVTFGNP